MSEEAAASDSESERVSYKNKNNDKVSLYLTVHVLLLYSSTNLLSGSSESESDRRWARRRIRSFGPYWPYYYLLKK